MVPEPALQLLLYARMVRETASVCSKAAVGDGPGMFQQELVVASNACVPILQPDLSLVFVAILFCEGRGLPCGVQACAMSALQCGYAKAVSGC
jgi:hypothetical protein